MKLLIFPNTIPIKEANSQGYKETEVGDGIDISTRMHHHRGNVQKGSSQTLSCRGGNSMNKELRIRKLTPCECMKLMGFTESDYQALRDIGMTDSAIYHMAGDSIITTCLVALLSPFVNEEHEHIKVIENYVEKEIINGN